MIDKKKVKSKKIKVLIFILLSLIFAGTAAAQDFGIYDLAAKTNMDSTDIFMLSIRSDSSYYKVYWDRFVDSIEDSIRGNIINSWIKSNAAIAFSKMATGTAGYVLLANGSGVPTYTNVTGDVTINSSGVTTIGASTIGSSEITNDQIVNADINSSAAIAYSKLSLSNSIVSADIVNGTITTSDITDGTIDYTDISSNAQIQATQLETALNGQIIISTTPGVPDWQTVSGDISLSNLGVVDLTDALADDFVFTGKHAYTPQLVTGWTTGSQTINGTGLKRFVVVDVSATSGVEITDVTNGVDGQMLTIIASGDAVEGFTIKNNSEILLHGATDIVSMDAWSSVSLVYYSASDVWIEVSRSIR